MEGAGHKTEESASRAMKQCSIAAVLLVLAAVASAADIGPHYCGVKYLELINKAIETKQECENAAFYDCCQVLA